MKYLFVFVSFSILLISCKKEDPQPTTGTTVSGLTNLSTVNSITASIDGATAAFTHGTDNYTSWSGYFNFSLTPDSTNAGLIWKIEPSNITQNYPSYQITFLGLVSQDDFDNHPEKVYQQIFSYGNHCFESTCGSSAGTIDYVDENNVKWTSSGVSQDSSAYLKISSSATVSIGSSGLFQRVKGNFSCKLQNSLGEIKNVTNGAFYFQYSK